MDDRYAEFELTLLVESPVWTRETEVRFKPAVEESGGVDFEFDFEFDFMAESGARSVSNDGMSSCDWLWRVYGPASSPQVRIGGNLHRVNVGVPDGARLEVDSARRSVRVVHDDGARRQGVWLLPLREGAGGRQHGGLERVVLVRRRAARGEGRGALRDRLGGRPWI